MAKIINKEILPGFFLPKKKGIVKVVVAPSGGNGGGFTQAVEIWVLQNSFGLMAGNVDVMYSVSAGLLNTAPWCANQTSITPQIYLDMTADGAIPRNVMDLLRWEMLHDYLRKLLAGEKKDGIKLDIAAFTECPARKFAIFSDARGMPRPYEIHGEEVLDCIQAAVAVLPYKGRMIDGHFVFDGAHAHAHAHCQFVRAVRSVLANYREAEEIHVLFLGNGQMVSDRDLSEYGMAERLASAAWTLGARLPLPRILKNSMKGESSARRSEQMFFRSREQVPGWPRIRLCGIFLSSPDELAGTWEQDPKVLESVGARVANSLRREIELL